MKTKYHQYSYSDELKDANSTSHLQIDADKVEISIETKCPICQEHYNIMGLTDAFGLRIKEDILTITDKLFHNDIGFHKDAFKIKYCPFCGRPLNEEDSNGESIDKSPTSGH